MTQANVTKTVWQKTVTKPIEWDLNVSDSKRDILKILSQKITGYVSECSIRDNLFCAKAVLCATLLYLPEGADALPVSALSHTDTIIIKEELPTSLVWDFSDVNLVITPQNPVFINSRKAGIRGRMQLGITLKENCSLATPNRDSDLECLEESVSAYTVLQCDADEFPVSLQFPLPAGKPPVAEILEASLQIRNQDVKPISNKVVAKGDYTLKLLYASTLSTLETAEFSSPFTEIMDAKTEDEGQLMYEMIPCLGEIKVTENEENLPKSIHASGMLQIKIQSIRPQEISLITDAYCPNCNVKLLKRKATMEQLEILSPKTTAIKELMELPDLQLESILDISCIPVLTSSKQEGDRILLSGDLDTAILYQTPSGVNSLSRQIPFELVEDFISPAPFESVSAKLSSNHFSYNILNQSSLELRMGVTAQICLHHPKECEYVEAILPDRENPVKLDRAPIVAYIIKPGDTLFNIAKKYATTVDRLKAVNNIENDRNLKVGSYLIIE